MNRRIASWLGEALLAAALGCSGGKLPPGDCGTDADCPADDPCQVGACDPATASCTFVRKGCDDRDLCTTDSCDPPTGVCLHAVRTCGDQDPCTLDSCVPATGECTHVPRPCDDHNPCTTDSCAPGSGECVFAPGTDGAPCDDGVPTTLEDACQEGHCIGQAAQDKAAPCRIERVTLLDPEVVFAVDGTPRSINDALGAGLTAEVQALRAGGLVALFDPLDIQAPTARLTFGEAACDLGGGAVRACALLPGGRTAGFPAITYSATGGCAADPTVESPCFLAPEGTFDMHAIAPDRFPAGMARVTGRALGSFRMTDAHVDRIPAAYVEGFVPESVGRAAVAGRSIDIGGGPVDLDEILAGIPTISRNGVAGWTVRLGFEAVCVPMLADLGCLAATAACDDEDACTVDACRVDTRQCGRVEASCDDGDPCTADSCEPATGCVSRKDYGPPSCRPVIDLAFPPRGATLGPGHAPLRVRGTARNPDGTPLASFTLLHDGTAYTVATTAGDGSFDQVVSPVPGLNTIVATALDAEGKGPRHVRGYCHSTRWYGTGPAAAAAPPGHPGLVIRVDGPAWDDNQPDYDDLAGLVQALGESAQLSRFFPQVQMTGVPLGDGLWNVRVSDIVVHDVAVDLDPQVRARQTSSDTDRAVSMRVAVGGMQAVVTLARSAPPAGPADVPLETAVTLGLAASGWLGFSGSGGAVSVNTEWPSGSSFLLPDATVTGLTLAPCKVGDLDLCGTASTMALATALEDSIEDALRLQAPALATELLNEERPVTLDLRTLGPQFPSRDVQASGTLSSVRIDELGATLDIDLAVSTGRAPGVEPTDTAKAPFLGSLGRGQGCPPDTPGWPVNADPASLALHDDALNQAIHALWWAGGLHQSLTQARLVELGGTDPATRGFADLVLETAPLLPPVINECTRDRRLAVQIADLKARATGSLAGRPFEATLYFTGDFPVALDLVPGAPTGRWLSIAAGAPTFADLEMTEVAPADLADPLRAGLQQVLRELPALLGLSRAYPLPPLDLTALGRTYLGISINSADGSPVVLAATPSAILRSAGYSVLTFTPGD